MIRALALLALAAVTLPSCTWFSGDSYVLVTSQPQGGRILVDGEDTGRTTPAKLDLGGMLGGDHVITVKKKGYRDETRTVYHYTEGYTSRWVDATSDMLLPPIPPVFWTTGDFLTPFGVKWAYVPHELMVKLYREGEPAPGAYADEER